MENDRHVILVISCIKPRNIQQRSSQAISKVLRIQCRLSVFRKVDRLALGIGRGDIGNVRRYGRRYE